jgi:hypothetical protein
VKLRHSQRFALVVALVTTAPAFACGPPPAIWLGEKGPQVPYEHPSFFAFLGKVVGHTSTGDGHPALSLLVLDAWSDRQEAGQVITIGVEQWIGCGLTKPLTGSAPFRPDSYPIGTRLRVISEAQTMYTWDVEAGLLVLATGT